ncbi:hypothetical protein IE979_03435 [Klebsiella pneumoniae]|uniref:Uncharacterized protein n=1 Tax=Klebsiella pneumoniae TaxID=573 RepID=A0A927HQ24_KLEPN|nr:hypothetical protein [Klebsiella pneumoniae]
MRAEPFNDEDEVKNINSLSEYLEDIVGGSEFISKTIDPKSVDESTVTDEMKGLRTLSFEKRRDFYVDGRINDQRDWYGQGSSKQRCREKMEHLYVRYLCISVLMFTL